MARPRIFKLIDHVKSIYVTLFKVAFIIKHPCSSCLVKAICSKTQKHGCELLGEYKKLIFPFFIDDNINHIKFIAYLLFFTYTIVAIIYSSVAIFFLIMGLRWLIGLIN